jgi:flagellar motor component MotA
MSFLETFLGLNFYKELCALMPVIGAAILLLVVAKLFTSIIGKRQTVYYKFSNVIEKLFEEQEQKIEELGEEIDAFLERERKGSELEAYEKAEKEAKKNEFCFVDST